MQFITKKLSWQFGKFALVGFLNTGIDFAVLNLLMWSFGIYSGSWLAFFNAIAFSAAVTNSYFWNKYWVFRASATRDKATEFTKFIIVSVIGLSLNTFIVYGFTTLLSPAFGIEPVVWANIGKVLATGVSLLWNFAGYKLFVFRT